MACPFQPVAFEAFDFLNLLHNARRRRIVPREGAHEVGREIGADDPGAEAEHVHVVVLDALVGRVHVVADCGADPVELARGDRRPDAGAADENPALCLAAEDRLADVPRLVG